MATYDSYFNVDADNEDLIGTYSCSVVNSAGTSSSDDLNIQGVTIIGNEAPLTIGSSSQITCSSDLNPLMIEWLRGDTVLVQAEGEHAYLTIPAVNDSLHGQEYHCKATTPYGVLEKNITITTTLPSSAVSVSTSAEGSNEAGERYTIHCMVRTPNVLSVLPNITWINPNGMEIHHQVNNTIVGSLIVIMSTVTFTPLLTSQSGIYMCQVSLQSPSLPQPLNMSDTVTISVQIPPPTIEVLTTPENGPFYAGSSLHITCVVEVDSAVDVPHMLDIVWKKSGETLENDYHISISNVTQLRSLSFQSDLGLQPLSTSLDTGEYTCQVEINLNPSLTYILSDIHATSEMVNVQDPPLVIEIDPPFTTVLDASPYNLILLACNVTQPEAVTLAKNIVWKEISPSGRVQTLNDTISYTNITYDGLEVSSSISTLSVHAASAGTWRFTCIASLDVPGDPSIVQSETTVITVKGESAPLRPMDTVHTTVTADYVVIEWLIPVIAYTPETYTVHYGPNEENLNFTSNVVIGTGDITAKNQIYSTTIRDLQSNTTYYYQIVAANSVGLNESELAQLITSPPNLMASIISDGSKIIGGNRTLTCYATRADNVTGNVNLQWIRPDGKEVITTEFVAVGVPTTSGATTSLSLQFTDLHTSNGGQYTCLCELISNGETLSVSVTSDVIVHAIAPTIQISTVPTDQLYAGGSVLLVCTLELSSRIDTEVRVSGIWRRGGEILENSGRINITDIALSESSILQTTLHISPISDTLDDGRYTCQTEFSSESFIQFTDAFQQVTLTIEALPSPAIIITTQGDSIVGRNYTLMCIVSTLEDITENVALSGTWTDINGRLLQDDVTTTHAGTTASIILHFSTINASHGGQYICNASITVPELSLVRTSSQHYDVVVQIPQPILNIMVIRSDVYLAGMPFDLRCLVTLANVVDTDIGVDVSWQRNGISLSDTARIQISQQQQPSLMGDYESLLRFDTLSSTSDSGDYVCSAILYPTESRDYISNSTGTILYNMTVIDPILNATVTPSVYSGIDVAPSNTFTLTCTASKPGSISPSLELFWYHNEELLDSSRPEVSIYEQEMMGGVEKSSVLTITSASSIDSGDYICVAMIDIPESNRVTSNQSATITIQGSLPPNVPTLLSSIAGQTQATISWIVTSVAYTLETYSVKYGIRIDDLDMTSNTTDGSSNSTAINQAYSLTITGLEPFTQYYYAIAAHNSFTTTESAIQAFRTTEAAPTVQPGSFSAVSIGSRNVTLSWTSPPESGRNGMILSYTVMCSDSNRNAFGPLTTTNYTAMFEDLSPFINHHCSVHASTSVGSGPSATLNFTTNSDVPEDAPLDAEVEGRTPSSVLITWAPPPTPNGVITSYIIYVNYTDGSPLEMLQSRSSATTYVVTNLQPYQFIIVEISASTSAGEGPKSKPVSGRSTEEAISPPDIEIYVEGTPDAGTSFTLLCSITIPRGVTTEPQIAWLSPAGNPMSSEGDVTVGNQPIIGNPSRLTTYIIQFSPLMTSHAGIYTCLVTLTSPFGTIEATATRSDNVTVQVPPPMVSASSPNLPVFAGSTLTLDCNIELTTEVGSEVAITAIWKRNGTMLVDTASQIISDVVEISSTSYLIQLMFNPLWLVLDDGGYNCEARIEPQVGFVLGSVSQSNSATLHVTAPTLLVAVQPAEVTALDHRPYNIFTLRCIANASQGVVLQKSFTWRNGEDIISDNGNTVLIANYDTMMPNSISELTVYRPEIGNYVYLCEVNISVPGGQNISVSSTGTATVKGESAPTQPTLVRTINISSSSATVQWVVPYLAYTPEEYIIHYGLDRESLDFASSTVYSTQDISAKNQSYENSLHDLAPNTMYYFMIHSENTFGEAMTTLMMLTTSEAGPSSPPTGFQVFATSPTSIQSYWSPPPEDDQNGVITSYVLTCQPETESVPATFQMSYPTAGSYNVSGFSPTITYNCSVYAVTAAGRGPSTSHTVTMPDDVPGPVTGLNFTKISATVIQVVWRRPQNISGRILSYSVIVKRNTQTVFQTTVLGDRNNVLVTNLNKYIPYTVMVRASTSAGYGPPTSDVMFTEEGVPNISPRNVGVVRLNVTHMNVTWTKLTLEEARGIITTYTVTYEIVSSRRRKEVMEDMSEPDNSYKVVGGLDFTSSYLVMVSASTAAGRGISSSAINAQAPPYSVFQLRIKGVPNCYEWTHTASFEKIQSISEQISSIMNRDCLCQISAVYITSAKFSCDSQETTDVVFRARLSSTPNINDKSLINFLLNWVTSGTATLTIQRVDLNIDSACDVYIDSFSAPICSKPPSAQFTTQAVNVASGEISAVSNIIGALVGTILVAIVIVLVVICALHIFKHRRQLIKYIPRSNNSHGRPIHITVNEYELDESYPGSIRSQSRSSIEKETEASYIDCTVYENPTIAQSEPGHMEEDENEKKD